MNINVDDLTYMIMNEVGLCVDKENYVIDQDYGTRLFLKGKAIKYKYNGIAPRKYKNEVYFDIMNLRFMNCLFTYYISKLQNIDNKYFTVFYQAIVDGEQVLEIKDENMNIIRSKAYKNDCLKYIDLIIKISESCFYCNLDLSSLDY